MRAELHQVFAALGDPARVAIVGLLRHRPMRSSDIAAALDEGRPATSRHIQILRRTGLVEEAPYGDDARERVYTLRQAPFREAMGWLEALEALWTDQLTALRKHVDAKVRAAPDAAPPRASTTAKTERDVAVRARATKRATPPVTKRARAAKPAATGRGRRKGSRA